MLMETRSIAKPSFRSESSYWAPARIGTYANDCELGAHYARELASHLASNHGNNLCNLKPTLQAMFAQPKLGGVEIGFIAELARMAAAHGKPR